MNNQFDKLVYESGLVAQGCWDKFDEYDKQALNKFAELIVEECRTVIVELYRKTSLELCGPLLTADEEIVKHFYGVEE